MLSRSGHFGATDTIGKILDSTNGWNDGGFSAAHKGWQVDVRSIRRDTAFPASAWAANGKRFGSGDYSAVKAVCLKPPGGGIEACPRRLVCAGKDA
jgi:hypothetical protein